MIISIPTEQGTFTVAINPPAKVLLGLVALLVLFIGYSTYQMLAFLMTAPPDFYLKLLAGLCLVALVALVRKGLRQ